MLKKMFEVMKMSQVMKMNQMLMCHVSKMSQVLKMSQVSKTSQCNEWVCHLCVRMSWKGMKVCVNVLSSYTVELMVYRLGPWFVTF